LQFYINLLKSFR